MVDTVNPLRKSLTVLIAMFNVLVVLSSLVCAALALYWLPASELVGQLGPSLGIMSFRERVAKVQ